jgi:hypothetical protein
VASTAESSTKVLVDSGEVGRSAVYIGYNNGPRSLLFGTSALVGESPMYLVSTRTTNRQKS